jgi:hypothetical protein
MGELAERQKTEKRTRRPIVEKHAFAGTRERCFICPNDILEREFRTFIVSG